MVRVGEALWRSLRIFSVRMCVLISLLINILVLGLRFFAFLTSGFIIEVVYHDTDEWISHSEVFHDADIDFWVSLDADLLYSLFKPEE